MKMAVFADIHGNRHGLTAVLHDIEERGADVVWCGGDLVGYGAHPADVVDLIRERGIPTVMGNYDDAIGYHRIHCGCDYPDEAAAERGLRSVRWTKEQTSDAQKGFLRSLPYRIQREFEGHQVALVHGSPASLTEYLFDHVPEETFRAHLAATGADILLFGHTHKPFHKVLDGRHLVNVGSAGKPKHGGPEATYVLLTITREAVGIETILVPYDYEEAARAIEATDLPHEFADMLRKGRG